MLPRAEVIFTFEDSDGRTVQGRQVCDNEWLLGKLDVGSEVTVAYLPKSSRKCVFLEPYIA
jgi:hypothetical protein